MRDAWGGKTQPQERPGPLQSADRHEDPENQRACSIAHYIPDNLTPECSLGFFCFVLLFFKKKTTTKTWDSTGLLLSAYVFPSRRLPWKLTAAMLRGSSFQLLLWLVFHEHPLYYPQCITQSLSHWCFDDFCLLHLACKVHNSRDFVYFFHHPRIQSRIGNNRWARNTCYRKVHNESHLPGYIKMCFHRILSLSTWCWLFSPKQEIIENYLKYSLESSLYINPELMLKLPF